jgi:hypothetical protein
MRLMTSPGSNSLDGIFGEAKVYVSAMQQRNEFPTIKLGERVRGLQERFVKLFKHSKIPKPEASASEKRLGQMKVPHS